MGKMPEITFPPEAEEMAITLAAFDIMKQFFKYHHMVPVYFRSGCGNIF